MIPTWNRRDLLAQVLADLAAQRPEPPAVIVVDNGSTDGASETARCAGAQVIRFEENRGFAAAVNAGIRAAGTEWVAILNNDVRLDSGWLAALLHSAQREQAAFACGRILQQHDPRRIDATFDAVCRGGLALRCGSGRVDGPYWRQPRRIAIAPMTAALFRRDLFDRAGGLDESFGSYLEDVDFGLRVAAAGFEGWYEPEAVAWHLGSATFGAWKGDTVRLLARNQILLAHKHFAYHWRCRVMAAQMLWGWSAWRRGLVSAWQAGRKEGRALVAEQPPAVSVDGMRRTIERSERLLREVQEETGWDWLWRIWFTFSGIAKEER